MILGTHRVGDVDDFSVEADEETNALGHAHEGHFDIIQGNDFAVGIGNEREVEIVFFDKLFVAFGTIVTHSHDGDVIGLQVPHAVAEAAGFLGAAAGEIFGIEIEQNDFLADEVAEVKCLAVLVYAGEQRRGIADFWHVGKN